MSEIMTPGLVDFMQSLGYTAVITDYDWSLDGPIYSINPELNNVKPESGDMLLRVIMYLGVNISDEELVSGVFIKPKYVPYYKEVKPHNPGDIDGYRWVIDFAEYKLGCIADWIEQCKVCRVCSTDSIAQLLALELEDNAIVDFNKAQEMYAASAASVAASVAASAAASASTA